MKRTNNLSLDSSFFIACGLAHRALKEGLTRVSKLNVTQYRALVKLIALAPKGIIQSELASLLTIKPNLASQAIDTLEQHGYALRNKDKGSDGRTRTIYITKAGITLAKKANKAIIEQLYSLFPTQNQEYRSLLEAAIAAGANIDPPLTSKESKRFFASRTLVSLELIIKITDDALRQACGASFNECLILLRLSELPYPLRISDLAYQLRLSSVTIARSTDRLVKRSWTQRLASPHDKKAVYVGATAQGAKAQKLIQQTIDAIAQTYLWSKLDTEQSRTLAQAGDLVLSGIQASEEAGRKAAFDLLEPID